MQNLVEIAAVVAFTYVQQRETEAKFEYLALKGQFTPRNGGFEAFDCFNMDE